MKSYKEMAENVLKRRDEALAKRKTMIVRVQRTVVLAACFVLIAALGVVLLQSGVFRGGELAPSSLPASSQPTESKVVSHEQPDVSAASPASSETVSATSYIPAPAVSSHAGTSSAQASAIVSSAVGVASQSSHTASQASTPNKAGTASKAVTSEQTSPIKSDPSHAAAYSRPSGSGVYGDSSGSEPGLKAIKRSFVDVEELIDYVQGANRDTLVLPSQPGGYEEDSSPELPASGDGYGVASGPNDSRDWDAIWPLFQYGTVPQIALPDSDGELVLRWCAINENKLLYKLHHYVETDGVRTVIGEMDLTLFADKDEGLTRLNNIRNSEHEEFDMHGTTYYVEKTIYGYCIVWVAHQAPQLDTYCMVKYHGNEIPLQQILSYLTIEWIPF